MSNQYIFSQFLIQAHQNPDLIAIRADGKDISYSELDMLSEALALRLIKYCQIQNKVIAIYGKRSAALVISILACSRAGLTFAVIDSAYPKERTLKMVQVISPAIIIGIDTSNDEMKEVFEELDDRTPLLSIDYTYLDKIKSLSNHYESLSTLDLNIYQNAYLLFTSGTTGLPKCIQTSHSPLVHFVDWYIKTFDVKAGTKFSLLSGIGHDPMLRDIFVPLSIGGIVIIPETVDIASPIKIFQWIKSNKISYLHATPQLLRIICAGAKEQEALPHLSYVFSGGDVLRASHVNELRKLANQCNVVNFYGSTETPQAMAFYKIKDNDINDPIPIGNGIADVKLHLLDLNMSPVLVGETGQIGIETEYLSGGYFNDQTTTNSKFIDSSYTSNSGKIYLTGDYGMLRSDGYIVLKGRIDDQVKIRGFRVELGEIVSALEQEATVQNAVVLSHQAQNGENFLFAYLMKQSDANISEEVLTNQVKEAISIKIPSYMVPNHYIWLESIPLLPNGKINRAELIKIGQEFNLDKANRDFHFNENENQESILNTLIKQWKMILNVSVLDTNKSFVALGGDSLSFIQASLVIEKNLGWLPEDWEKKPLNEIAKLKPKLGNKTTRIGMPILIRALSIALIVLGHFGILEIAGSTVALFIISGWSIGKYQINTILTNNSIRPFLSTITKIFIPTALITALLQLFFMKNIYWLNLIGISNFINPNYGYYGGYWFVMVMMQNLIVLAFIFYFKKIRELFRKNFYRSSYVACLLMILAMNVAPSFWNTDYLFNRLPHMTIWAMFLGMNISSATSYKQKILSSLLVFIPLYIINNPLVSSQNHASTFPLISSLLIINFQYIAVPSILGLIINAVAESSLFIYLTHFQSRSLINHTFLKNYYLAQFIVALIIGYISLKFWNKYSKKMMGIIESKSMLHIKIKFPKL